MTQNFDAAQAIAAAVAQIELAVREVRPAVEQLGGLVDAMSGSLKELRDARPREAEPGVIAQFPDKNERTLAKLEKQVYGSITQLQFYDRLVQHLAHVQNYLSGVSSQLADPVKTEQDVWDVLRGTLRVRLISESQRQLLDAILPPPEGPEFKTEQARDEHAAQGTVELF